MRDELVHDYFGVDWDLVWKVVAQHLPAIKQRVDSIPSGG